jgi:hypothetical protein
VQPRGANVTIVAISLRELAVLSCLHDANFTIIITVNKSVAKTYTL